jgi:hypothetical protein
MGIDEWSATQGPALWPLLNVVTWRQMFHGHWWMKCYPSTSPLAITECCDLETDVPWASMNEVVPRDQPYGHYWMLWLGDRCSMGIDEYHGVTSHMITVSWYDQSKKTNSHSFIIYFILLQWYLNIYMTMINASRALKVAGSRRQIASYSTFCTLLLRTWPNGLLVVNVP